MGVQSFERGRVILDEASGRSVSPAGSEFGFRDAGGEDERAGRWPGAGRGDARGASDFPGDAGEQFDHLDDHDMLDVRRGVRRESCCCRAGRCAEK